jgi:maltose alpha-D-glucosyltransferase/alpha-amylase
VNVAAQEADPDSLLNKVRRLIAVRKQHPVFGRGDFSWRSFSFESKAVVAYQRKWQDSRIVVLNNLRNAPVKGWIPETAEKFIDILSGETVLPGDYTLSPYGFLWLLPVDDHSNPTQPPL